MPSRPGLARVPPRPSKDGFVPFLTMDAPGDDPRAAVRWNVFAPLDEAGGGVDSTLKILSAFLALKSPDSSPEGLKLSTRQAFLWKLQAFRRAGRRRVATAAAALRPGPAPRHPKVSSRSGRTCNVCCSSTPPGITSAMCWAFYTSARPAAQNQTADELREPQGVNV